MNEQGNRYGWAAYYAAAYERERKKNIVLAGKIADAERRQADLNDNLNRIYANPFWKLTAPFRKLYHGAKNVARHSRYQDGSPEADPYLLYYMEEVRRQQNPYQEWIGKQNNDSYENDCFSVNGWQSLRVPDSDIILLAYGRGILDKNTFSKVKSCFNTNKYCKIAYADEDFYWEDLSGRMHPWFKPGYSPDTMLSFHYWGHLVAVKADLLSVVLSGQKMESRTRQTSQAVRFYDLCLCMEEEAFRRCRLEGVSLQEGICHIDGVLYHRAYEPSGKVAKELEECREPEERFRLAKRRLGEELENGQYTAGAGEEYCAVREAALRRRGLKGSLTGGQEPGLYHIVYDTSISGAERCARARSADRHVAPHHEVSVVIPSKDHPDVLRRCLESFRRKTEYRYYEWIVVDNGSNEENRAKMEELRREYGFTYLYEKMDFNFSRMCNMGAAKARGDLLLFLNDDVEIIEQSWLRRMAGQALQQHVGAVGAKLWYADTQRIQHVGITNMEIGPSHKLVTFPDDKDYYYGRNRVAYDMAGVTAACLMVSRSKYEQVGGMDETMAVSYNDVDLCFKLSEAGYYNVQRNDAVLFHHESLSRGLDEQDDGKWDRLLEEKENLYTRHPQMKGYDPFYNKALIDNASDYVCNYKFPYEQRLHTVVAEPVSGELCRKANIGRLQLTVDRAQIQHKVHAGEPDILWIMGWCYVPGADNAVYEKHLLLRRIDGDDYTAVPENWYRRDVEEILPMERNICLAGFVLRVLREDLVSGTYQIGMLCVNQASGAKELAWSDKTCEI